VGCVISGPDVPLVRWARVARRAGRIVHRAKATRTSKITIAMIQDL
jgi:hypothetical protein